MESLKHSVDNFKNFIPIEVESNAVNITRIETKTDNDLINCHDIHHVDKTSDGFIDQTMCDELINTLKDLPGYKDERGRSTLKFGENYNYNGSKAKPNDFPACVKQLLDILNEQFKEDTSNLNSCLVTKYNGPKSYIPKHSDNEHCINPESKIYTISLGHDCKIKYSDVYSGEEFSHTATNGSLYVMSRASQEFYIHHIDANDWTNMGKLVSALA